MLSLEAEAALPPEYGPIEISYRQLPSKNDRCDRYEVYVARREVVGSFLSSLRETGISADLILPSAVAWREVLADNPHAGVLVVDSCCGGICEIALSHEDGTLSVRTVGVAEGKDGHAALEAALTECVRSLAKHSENGSRPVVAGWLGRGPAPVVNGSAVFEPLRPLEDVATKGADQRPLDPAGLLAAAASLTASFDMEALRCSSLLPQEMVQKAARRVLHRNMAGGIAGIIVAMVLAYVGLKVTTNRYWDAGADLGAKIAQITDGTSHTFAMLEMVQPPGEERCDRRGRIWCEKGGCGNITTFLPPNSSAPDEGNCQEDFVDAPCIRLGGNNQASNTKSYTSSRSRHSGGVQALMCDASAHFVSDGIDLPVWQAMSTMSWEETFDPPF